jgi:hypothetical protein
MTVFVVLKVSSPQLLKPAIESKFPNDHLYLGKDEWLVSSASMTSRDVSDALGVSEGPNGDAVVLAVAGFWGRATQDVWEWLTLKMKGG